MPPSKTYLIANVRDITRKIFELFIKIFSAELQPSESLHTSIHP